MNGPSKLKLIVTLFVDIFEKALFNSYIPSIDKLADFFTKSQLLPRLSKLVSKLSMLTFSHQELERGVKTQVNPMGWPN